MSKRIAATTYDVGRLKDIIQDLERRFGALDGGDGQADTFFGKVVKRQQHFHNLPAVDPVLPAPYQDGPKFQTDVPRRVHSKLKSRLLENHFMFAVTGRDTALGRKNSTALKTVLQSGFMLSEERYGVDIQGGLADGQIVTGLGWLHWDRADEVYEDAPDYDELDDLPEDEAEAKRYTEDDYIPVEGEPQRSKQKRYRETDVSLQDRIAHQRAKAGYPYCFEIIPAESIMWQEDRSAANGLARVVVRREVGLLDYAAQIAGGDGPITSENEADPDVSVMRERDAPAHWMPSGENWGERVTLYQFWTRDEFYELVSGGGDLWEIAKSGPHRWKMPPFAKAPAIEFNSADPALRYEPALEGVFRIKPFYDYQVTLQRCISESIALPFYYLAKTDVNAPDLDEEGKTLFFSRNAAASMKVPDGYEIRQLQYQMNPAFVQATSDLRQDLLDAMPSTGQAEFTTSTQPWAIRLQQAQESVEPGRYMANQARVIQICARSIAADMSERPDTVYVYALDKDGKLDRSTTVGVDPKDIQSLDIDVTISNISAAEKVTLTQVGKDLLDDPNVPITPETFLRDYMLDDDPQATIADWTAWKAFMEMVWPGLLKQLLAKVYGTSIQYAPDGAFVGAQGQQMTPEQVLQANGQQPLPPPPQAPQALTGGPGAPPPPQTMMPSMPAMQAPNTMPLAGMR